MSTPRAQALAVKAAGKIVAELSALASPEDARLMLGLLGPLGDAFKTLRGLVLSAESKEP